MSLQAAPHDVSETASVNAAFGSVKPKAVPGGIPLGPLRLTPPS